MKRSTILLAALLLTIGGSGAVYAYSKHKHWHSTPAEKVEFVTDRVSKRLDLTDQQRNSFVDLANTVAEIMVEVKANRSQHMVEVNQLLDDARFDRARATELVQQKTEMINTKAPLVISQLGTFLDSLDDDQKQQIRDLIQHYQEHHRHDHGDR